MTDILEQDLLPVNNINVDALDRELEFRSRLGTQAFNKIVISVAKLTIRNFTQFTEVDVLRQ